MKEIIFVMMVLSGEPVELYLDPYKYECSEEHGYTIDIRSSDLEFLPSYYCRYITIEEMEKKLNRS